jgi:hypothetical protein
MLLPLNAIADGAQFSGVDLFHFHRCGSFQVGSKNEAGSIECEQAGAVL